MKASDAIKQVIKSLEGLHLVPYTDLAGFLTIGYGHKVLKEDKNLELVVDKVVAMSSGITLPEADRLFDLDLAVFEKGVNKRYPGLNQTQFDAIVSFAFNLGLGALDKSTLNKFLLQKDWDSASKEILRWVYGRVKGRPTVVDGLAKRRDIEQNIFISELKPMKLTRTLYRGSLAYEVENILLRYSKEIFTEHKIKIELSN